MLLDHVSFPIFHQDPNLVFNDFKVWSRTILQKDKALSSQSITVFNIWSCWLGYKKQKKISQTIMVITL